MKRIAIEVKFISVEEKIKFLVSRSKYCYEFSQNFHFALFALCRRMNGREDIICTYIGKSFK